MEPTLTEIQKGKASSHNILIFGISEAIKEEREERIREEDSKVAEMLHQFKGSH